jgi:hypothetical protein
MVLSGNIPPWGKTNQWFLQLTRYIGFIQSCPTWHGFNAKGSHYHCHSLAQTCIFFLRPPFNPNKGTHPLELKPTAMFIKFSTWLLGFHPHAAFTPRPGQWLAKKPPKWSCRHGGWPPSFQYMRCYLAGANWLHYIPANFVHRHNEKWLFMISDSAPQNHVLDKLCVPIWIPGNSSYLSFQSVP